MTCFSLSRHVSIKLARNVLGINNMQCCCQFSDATGEEDTRINHANIQMLSKNLHSQIFKNSKNEMLSKDSLNKVKQHLVKHGLWDKSSTKTKPLLFDLPELYGENIEEHFKHIAKKATTNYFALAESMSSTVSTIPEKPSKWLFCEGWTRYASDGGVQSVSCPEDDVLVFDVEVCMQAGNVPILATAVSKKAWYCWVSPFLTDNTKMIPKEITPDCMIPTCNDINKPKLLIGHNVAFDRSYVQEPYQLKDTSLRFLDTMSLHVCVSGVTNEQRNYMNQKNPSSLYEWMSYGSTNSLAKLYEFYCNKTLDKSKRDLFVEGSLEEIQENFQECANYCATDVKSTFEIYQIIWPDFLVHVPHPVSFCGMLEMGTSYLPITHSWKEYILQAEEMYVRVTEELKGSLMKATEDVLRLMPDERFKENLWTWNMDWSIHKTARPPKDASPNSILSLNKDTKNVHNRIRSSVGHLSEKRIAQLHLPGYPKWYRELCPKNEDDFSHPKPTKISSQTQVTPYILQMTWDGYPLHYEPKFGWGYLAPMKSQMHNLTVNVKEKERDTGFPYSSFIEFIKSRKEDREDDLNQLKLHQTFDDMSGMNIGLPCIRFFKLPHKNGNNFNVGNPLAKDFLSKIEDGTLSTSGGYNAKVPIEFNKMLAFWRNGRKRICSQQAVWLNNNEKSQLGVILPQVVTAGTVTRRAVEPTWLTASNPLTDRIGSELKSLVRAPPGYFLVGADVDSQELWIASILGDAQFAKVHGCTALSWMTLQGKKSERTDLHSKTADTIGMSRDQAKIFNYGRVYGAGEPFAVRLLMQFNHNLTQKEAEKTAAKLYETTKGVKRYRLNQQGLQLAEDLNLQIDDDNLVSYVSLKRLLKEGGLPWSQRTHFVDDDHVWFGGSESDMFNKLESIAMSEHPRTPVLGCLVTKALFPKHVENHYKTSRVNWVVQSSAVDYLHLMLTCMKWLIDKYNIDARFCVSIHDEVRYIVKDEDKYRLALALQITNLLTRSMFAHKLDLNDLPQSVAFFSSVDIDKVLRKEVDLDCVTPSNPDGLKKGHGIQEGESLDIFQILDLTNGGTFH